MSEYEPKELRRQAEQWSPIGNKELAQLRRDHAAALEELAALREQLAERDAEIAALKGSEYRAGMRAAALIVADHSPDTNPGSPCNAAVAAVLAEADK